MFTFISHLSVASNYKEDPERNILNFEQDEQILIGDTPHDIETELTFNQAFVKNEGHLDRLRKKKRMTLDPNRDKNCLDDMEDVVENAKLFNTIKKQNAAIKHADKYPKSTKDFDFNTCHDIKFDEIDAKLVGK